MGRALRILLSWILGTVVVFFAIFGSRGSLFCIFQEISELPHVSPFARRFLLGPSKGVEIKLQPSSMLAPSLLAQNEPVKLELGPSPSSDISAMPPHIGQRASSPSSLRRPEGEHAPSAVTPREEVSSPPPIISRPTFEVVPPPGHASNPPVQASVPSDHGSMEHRWPGAISPSVQSQAPNAPFGTVRDPSHMIPPLPQISKGMQKGHVHADADAPALDANASVASPQAPASSPAQTVLLSPHSTKPHIGAISPSVTDHAQSPAVSPTLAVSPAIRKKRFGMPVAAPPVKMTAPAPLVHHSSSEGPFPRISPSAPEANMPLNSTHSVSHAQPPHGSKFDSPASPPMVSITMPTARKNVGTPVSAPTSHSPLTSHTQSPAGRTNVGTPVSAPTAHSPLTSHTQSPAGRKNVGTPAPAPTSHSSLTSHTQSPAGRKNVGIPVPAPTSHSPLTSHTQSPAGRKNVGTPVPAPTSHSPLTSHTQSPAGNFFHNSASAPKLPNHPGRTRKRMASPAFSPLSPPSSYTTGPVMSPSSSDPPSVFPNRRHYSPPPYVHGPSITPDLPPSAADSNVAPASTPSSFIPSSQNEGPNQYPMLSPSGSFSRMPAPWPQPIRALPPPPPNLDCTLLTCAEPLTNSPPGSPCACVLPIKVGLRLSVALYTFFPLVSELALEIASGVSMKQSQVRIMGANAASDDSYKTIVLLDLVSLGQSFDYATALSTYVKFWHKQVIIKPSLYGDYDVLYVLYPGLPTSPPTAPADINPGEGAFGNDNGPRTIKPLGVDVGKQKEKLSGSLVAVIVLSSVIALVLCVGAAWLLLLKHRNHRRASTPQPLLLPYTKSSGTGPNMIGSRPSSVSGSFSSSIATYTGSAKTFSLAEMDRATNGFDDSRIIGEGGFGLVYQGTLEDGTRVAVKVLKRDDHQGGREFVAEVEMLSRLHHRNLVKLIGICTEEHSRCLVYELIPNGSVESHLHGVDKVTAPLDWSARMKIALGAARGLAYLHEDSSPRVIHRDFKSSNILLEHDFTPKVSDFGLARSALEEGNEHISTRVMGTFGYVAPEYAMTGHLLVKSDVYSYGVVLLELLTGRKPVDMSQPPGQENLVAWASPLLTSQEGLEMIIDTALGANVSFDSLAKVAAIASMCVQPEVSHRPFMGEVVQALKLVCDEVDECRESGSCSQDDLSAQDPETRVGAGFGSEAQRVLSATDVFSTSARYTREGLGSFRRHSSSGPLRTGRSRKFLQQMRASSSGSLSDHGTGLRLGKDSGQWS